MYITQELISDLNKQQMRVVTLVESHDQTYYGDYEVPKGYWVRSHDGGMRITNEHAINSLLKDYAREVVLRMFHETTIHLNKVTLIGNQRKVEP